MLNTQITSYLGVGRQQTSSERAKETKEESLLGKSGKIAKFSHSNRCTETRVWMRQVEKKGVLYSSTDSSCSEIWRPLDEEKREKGEISANPHGEQTPGHFQSKFNNRRPLSLHPVPMVTDKSGLFPNTKDANPEETKRIVRNLDKIRVERNKTGKEKFVFRLEGNETKGEKTIKLAREKNTLPEVIIKHRLHEREKRHFLPRVNDKAWSAPPTSMNRRIDFDNTISLGNRDVRDPITKRSVLAWSACVVPATLVDFPSRKRSPLMASLKRPRKRVQNNMADALRGSGKPAAYTEQRDQVLPPRTSAGKPPSTLLYPLHHGY